MPYKFLCNGASRSSKRYLRLRFARYAAVGNLQPCRASPHRAKDVLPARNIRRGVTGWLQFSSTDPSGMHPSTVPAATSCCGIHQRTTPRNSHASRLVHVTRALASDVLGGGHLAQSREMDCDPAGDTERRVPTADVSTRGGTSKRAEKGDEPASSSDRNWELVPVRSSIPTRPPRLQIQDIFHKHADYLRALPRELLPARSSLSKSQQEIVLRALKYHPKADKKLGCGVDFVFVQRSLLVSKGENHRKRRTDRLDEICCFYVKRFDGSEEDFSLLKIYGRSPYRGKGLGFSASDGVLRTQAGSSIPLLISNPSSEVVDSEEADKFANGGAETSISEVANNEAANSEAANSEAANSEAANSEAANSEAANSEVRVVNMDSQQQQQQPQTVANSRKRRERCKQSQQQPQTQPLQGASFSVSGFLFAYHCGVMAELLDAGVLVPGSTELAGASGGGIIVTLASCGVPMAAVRDAQKAMYRQLLQDPQLEVQQVLTQLLDALLPPDAARRIQASDAKVKVAVARAWPPPIGESKMVAAFFDRQDLLDAVVTGCYIGFGVVGKRLTREWRGEPCFDGGIISRENKQPPLECTQETDGVTTIRVCAYPSAVQSNIPGLKGALADIYPDLGNEWGLAEAWKFMLKGIGRAQPGGFQQALTDVDVLYDLGRATAQTWIQSRPSRE